MNTTLQPTTPRMGDMVCIDYQSSSIVGDAFKYLLDVFYSHGAIVDYSVLPSKDHGYWLCWTENNTIELGEKVEHLECLINACIEPRITSLFYDKSGIVYAIERSLSEVKAGSTTSSNRTAYADNINYYKRMIQQGTYPQNKLTRDQAMQKLGYWEGRYDELTAGGRGE